MRLMLRTAVLATLAAGTAGAQNIDAQCKAGSTNFGFPDSTKIVQDGCQKAIDLFRYMMPQLGISLTGGNAILGQGSTLGGFPHFSVGVRGNVVKGTVPQFDKINLSTTGAQNSTIPTKDQVIGLPTADAAIGLFGGIPLGITNLGGLDLLVSAFYIPKVDAGQVHVDVPNGSLKLGFGGRLGLIQQSALMPGVSVTYLRRDLPTVNVSATTNQGDSFNVQSFKVETTAWRLTASKTFLFLGVVVGTGGDQYRSSAKIAATVAGRVGPPPTQTESVGPIAMGQNMTRKNSFVDLSMNLPLFKIVAEVGQVSGGVLDTYNAFQGTTATSSRVYGSAGLRFAF